MPLDEATAALLEQLTASRDRPLHEMTPQEARGVVAAMRGEAAPGPEMAEVRDTRVRVSGGLIPVRVLTPGRSPARRHRVLPRRRLGHSAGWTNRMRSPAGWRSGRSAWWSCRTTGSRPNTGSRPPSMTPGRPWAGPPRTRPELAGGPAPLIVAGDSAGGNLAAVMTQRAVARGGPPIAVQVLAYPVTDCDLDTTSYTDPANQLMLTRDSMTWFWDHYAPDRRARAHPDASPLRRGSSPGCRRR